MKIVDAEYETSVVSKSLPVTTMPEIAIAGRSNVGKSSFINMLTARKKLARSSAEPGRTRMLNYFNINKGAFYLVDLPGYGFARVSDKEKEAWKDIIEYYLTNSKNLKHVYLIVDIRHEPSASDLQLAEYLTYYDIPFTVLATKADKLSRMAASKAAFVIKNAFPDVDIIVISSENGTGREEVLSHIATILSE